MNYEHYKLAKLMQASGSQKSVDDLLLEISTDLASLSPSPGTDNVIGEMKEGEIYYEILGDGSRREKQP